MATHHSADARTALMATYIARYANARAGMGFTSGAACSPGSREWNGGKGKEGRGEGRGGSFGARGRTIYNADKCRMRRKRGGKDKCAVLRELERIDAEEERRRRCGEQFLMAARGDFELDEGARGGDGDDDGEDVAMAAEEMFGLYIHI